MTVKCDGKEFIPITKPELVNVGAPAVAKFMVIAYPADSVPDEHGFFDLYDLFFEGDDLEQIDWDNAAYMVPSGGTCNQRGYNPATGQVC